MTKTFYVLRCLDCDDASFPMPIPFESPEARGKWATEHRRGTGHDRWKVTDEIVEVDAKQAHR